MSEVIEEQRRRNMALIKAMNAVAVKVGKIAKDDFNQHSKYKFASIDNFLEAINPAMAEAGLVPFIQQVSAEVVERLNQYNKTSLWERSQWDCTLMHIDGGTYGAIRRVVEVPLSGAQTNGSAQSYVQKVFYRMAFNIPTGDPDSDTFARNDAPPSFTTDDVPKKTSVESRDFFKRIVAMIRSAPDVDELGSLYVANRGEIEADKYAADIIAEFTERKTELVGAQ
jgi:hypothetical protein